MMPHKRRARLRSPYRSSENQSVLLQCDGCDITVASEDARKHLGLDVVAATGWRPIERWREKLKLTCPACSTRMYRVCARHDEREVLYELCPACKLIIFEAEGYDELAAILSAAHAAPKLRKPRPRKSLVDRLSKPKKK